jgi:hypothetical protein
MKCVRYVKVCELCITGSSWKFLGVLHDSTLKTMLNKHILSGDDTWVINILFSHKKNDLLTFCLKEDIYFGKLGYHYFVNKMYLKFKLI